MIIELLLSVVSLGLVCSYLAVRSRDSLPTNRPIVIDWPELEHRQVVEPLAEVQHKEVRLKQVSVNTTQDERNEWRRESHKVSHKSKLGVGINLEDVPMSWNWDDEKPF